MRWEGGTGRRAIGHATSELCLAKGSAIEMEIIIALPYIES